MQALSNIWSVQASMHVCVALKSFELFHVAWRMAARCDIFILCQAKGLTKNYPQRIEGSIKRCDRVANLSSGTHYLTRGSEIATGDESAPHEKFRSDFAKVFSLLSQSRPVSPSVYLWQ